ncbi:MAG: ABC transporter ATP-binding protein [Deltaproteobacteria bacterium]|nr:ABC transporter ATP-binding protein [Deltaproteobacteria bacterium]
MEESLIWTEGATKIYNPRLPDEMVALDKASITIRQGQVTVLKGPSGSGKTSLLSIIGCMSRPTAGRVVVKGKDVAKLPERFLTGIRRNTFGFIFQQFNLIREVSVQENVALPFYPMKTGFTEIRERVDRMLDQFGILAKKNLKVKKLSGGEQQRVAIARALINDPEIIIADEPTAHLDQALAEDLVKILDGFRREGRTIVIATHDPFIFESNFVDRTISMRNGQIERVSER